jgi:hypothetical protein
LGKVSIALVGWVGIGVAIGIDKLRRKRRPDNLH